MAKMTAEDLMRLSHQVTKFGMEEMIEALSAIAGANKRIAESGEGGSPDDPEKLIDGHTGLDWAEIERGLDRLRDWLPGASASVSPGDDIEVWPVQKGKYTL